MPEAPEVQTVLSTLETQIKDFSIEDVLVYYSKILDNVEIETFKHQLIGQTFHSFNRLGKYLIFGLDEIFAFCQKQINALFESTEQVIKEIVSSLKSKLEPIFQMETLPFKFKIDEVVALACREAKRLYAQWDGDWESINKNEMSKVQEDFIAYFTPKEHNTSDFIQTYDYSSREYARNLSKFVCDEIFALCQKQINARFNLNPHKQAIKEQEKRLINARLQKAKMKAMRIIIAKRFNKPSLMVCSHCGFIKYTSIMPNKPQCERCGALMSKKEL